MKNSPADTERQRGVTNRCPAIQRRSLIAPKNRRVDPALRRSPSKNRTVDVSRSARTQPSTPMPRPTSPAIRATSDRQSAPSASRQPSSKRQRRVTNIEKTIENPISDISQPNQPPTLCKNNPEIDSCTVCRHPEHETLREILTLPHDIHKISAKWNIPVLDLWRCRLHHLEDPTHFYSIIGAAARKSRLFDATDLNPQVILDEDPIEDFENGQEQSYAA